MTFSSCWSDLKSGGKYMLGICREKKKSDVTYRPATIGRAGGAGFTHSLESMGTHFKWFGIQWQRILLFFRGILSC
jgi:hypothetical protein